MLTGHAQAPTYQELRPLKPPTGPTFPVYPDLAELLVRTEKHPDDRVAHVLGTCAGYAYSDERTVAMIMARLGLEENSCVRIAQSVDAMFICSTAFLVQSRCGRVAILCYRGTEPTSLINWLTDADVNPDKVAFRFADGQGPFDVHAGFYRNVRATRYEVVTALLRAIAGQSVVPGATAPMPHRLEALYVTGHSLGAAMAALMAVMLRTNPAYRPLAERLRAVYTFGQPMIGDPALAAACQRDPFLAERLVRVVFGHDVVPALPPAASGPFAHFGPEHQLIASCRGLSTGRLREKPTEQVSNPLDLPLASLAFVAHQLRRFRRVPFQHSFDDHGPQHYVAALTPAGVQSEFGGE